MAEITLRDYCELISDKTEQGRYGEALAHAKHILSQYPKYATAYRLLGETLLEAGQDEHAIEMFQRVLSADPENLLAWVGLGECYNRQGKLDAAVWYMERAFELASDNRLIEEQLRRLQERRGGVELQRVQLTRGALARLYLKGDLLPRAIAELRRLLTSHPERVDLRAALAEALWRNEQRLEASETCQQILDELPFCLKANLIMGSIWSSAGRAEANLYLRRAEAVDPENRVAAALFGPSSLLPPRDVMVTLLDYRPVAEEERPAWLASLEAATAVTETETALAGVPSPFSAQIEIPSWLAELGWEEPSAEEAPAIAEAAPEEELAAEPAEAEAILEERLAWLTGATAAEEEARPAAAAGEEAVPEWLREVEAAPLMAGEAQPAGPVATEDLPPWAAMAEMEMPVLEAAAPPEDEGEPLPDWLTQLESPVAEERVAPTVVEPVGETVPTRPEPQQGESLDLLPPWLEELTQQAAEYEPTIPGESGEATWPTFALPEASVGLAELEEWPAAVPPGETVAAQIGEAPEMPSVWPEMTQLEAATAIEPPVSPAAAERLPAAEGAEVAMPEWLTEGELPSGDEALAWLERLAAGKEEELRAQAIAEGERSYAEIMGRPKPPEVPVTLPGPAAMPSTETPEVSEAPEEAIVAEETPEVVEVFGWTTFGVVTDARSAEEMPAERLLEETAPLEITEGVMPLAPEPAPALAAAPEPLAQILEIPEAQPAAPVPFEPEPVEPEPTMAEAPGEAAAFLPAAPPVALAAERAAEPAAVPLAEEIETTVPEAVAPVEEKPAPVDALVARRLYVRDHPRDHAAWLELARLLRAAGERDEALKAYARALRGRDLTDSVIEDVEALAAEHPDAASQQLLGDAYMKAGRLQDALRAYRQALQAI